jgi:hypothetical protein
VDPVALDGQTEVHNVTANVHPATLQQHFLSFADGVGNLSNAVLNVSTYLGGAGEDGLCAIALDNAGNIYVSGYFEVTPGNVDAFAAKLNNTATSVLWATTFGSSDNLRDEGHGLAVAPDGSAVYLTGSLGRVGGTPVCPTDGFVAKLDGGTGLITAAVVAPMGDFQGVALGFDAMGNINGVYVAGWTCSNPMPPGVPGRDVLMAKFDKDLAQPDPSFYAVSLHFRLGMPAMDADSCAQKCCCIAVDPSGNIYVSGTIQQQGSTNIQALYLSLNGAGTMVRWAIAFNNLTMAGGTGGGGTGVAFLGGKLYVTGTLDNGTAFPMHQDMLVAKIDAATGTITRPPAGTDYGFFYFNGTIDPTGMITHTGDLAGNCIKVKADGSVYIAGYSFDTDPMNPTKMKAVDAFHIGPTGDMVIDSLDTPMYLLDGTNDDVACGVAVDAQNVVYLAGVTKSMDFPTTAGVVQPAYGGGLSDGFISKVNMM